MTAVRGRTDWQKFVDSKLNDHDKRLTEQEKANAVYQALHEEQRKYLNDRFNRVQDNINETKENLNKEYTSIRSSINRVLMAVVIAIVIAFVNFALKGGLKL